MIKLIVKLFKKPFKFPNYLPTKSEIFERFVDENRVELKGNEERIEG
ncbi:hypothetical protein LCGC14_1505550 [marine sediment metagenome]|uniref:Uncharacterized protein n=1 Tax=marine sediment metagenome TaxID=412755 RepID=A0A0F9LI55_9ZZZZ